VLYYLVFAGLIGLLFSNNKEPAFAALKMTQSVALFGFFMSSQYLCTQVKVIVVAVTLVLATVGYLMLEASLHLEKKGKKKREAKCQVKIIISEKSMKQPINA